MLAPTLLGKAGTPHFLSEIQRKVFWIKVLNVAFQIDFWSDHVSHGIAEVIDLGDAIHPQDLAAFQLLDALAPGQAECLRKPRDGHAAVQFKGIAGLEGLREIATTVHRLWCGRLRTHQITKNIVTHQGTWH